MDYRFDIPTYVDNTDLVNVVVEIPKGSRNKYEVAGNGDRLTIVRTMHKSLFRDYKYIFNYGFIANTIAEDHDQLDAIVIDDEPINPLTVVQCKVIGVVRTVDNGEQDDKILCVPVYSKKKSVNLDKILKFLKMYKYPDQEGTVIGDVLGKDDAHKIIIDSRRYMM